MSKIAVAGIFLLGSAFAAAGEYKFINTDGSVFGELCIAAVESTDKDTSTLKALAVELGLAPVEVDSIACNGKSLKEFANKFTNQVETEEGQEVHITTYVVNVADKSPETQLCFAALVSEEEFTKLKVSHFSDVKIESEIVCNGLPIKSFVRKYRDHLAANAGSDVNTASL